MPELPPHNPTDDVPSPSLLDPLESTLQPPTEPWQDAACGTQIADVWRHSGWADVRHRVDASLRRTMQSASRVVAFECCGSGAHVYESVDEPGKYRVGGSGCHDRFCIPCSQDRSRLIGQNVIDFIDARPVRFCTLTLKHQVKPLAEQLDRLAECLRRLRRTRFWKGHVTGGAAFLEVTRNQNGEWHPHYHMLIEGTYLPYADLKAEWLRITGDSSIVDIRMARGTGDVVTYVTKYVSKPFTGKISRDPDAMDELVTAMLNRKQIVAFGTWKKLVSTKTDDTGEWTYLCTMAELVQRAADQHARYQAVLASLQPTHYVALIDVWTEHAPTPPKPPPVVIGRIDSFLYDSPADPRY